jgi:alpha-tubulin suppressor-like RCC1 family protein
LTFASIAVGQFHTCAITVAGAGYCWGAGGSGRIGDGSGPGDKLTPTLVSGGLTFASISTRNASTCAVTTGNAAYCWGRGDSGQLGDGARTDRTVPTLVGVGLTFTAISAGDAHTCGVRSGGAANCWGSAGDGRLGISDWFLPGTVVGALAFSTP